MNGVVDEFGRAFVPVQLKHRTSGKFVTVHAWIDTGFTGDLLLPTAIVGQLALPLANLIQAELGDGTKTAMPSYECTIDWFGAAVEIELLAAEIEFPLLGVALLEGHQLSIDYELDRLSLS